MFNLVKKPTPGVCPAHRCKQPSADVPDNSHGLCKRHWYAWEEEGRPPFDSAASAPSAALALGATPDLRAEVVQPLEVAAIQLRDQLQAAGLTIDSPERNEAVGRLAAHAQAKIKEIKAQRQRATAPLQQAQREINGWFADALAAYVTVKTLCHEAMTAWQTAVTEARDRALAAGDHDTAMALPAPELPAGTHARKRFLFRVTNPALVPPEHWVINAASVQAIVDRDREKTQIPGIEVYQDETLVTRGAK